MLEEAIQFIQKEIDKNTIQLNNLSDNIRTKTVQKAAKQIQKHIKILNYILKKLNKQKK